MHPTLPPHARGTYVACVSCCRYTIRIYLLFVPVGAMRNVVLHRETKTNLAGGVSLTSDVPQGVPIVLGFQGPLLVPQHAPAIQLDNLSYSRTRDDEGGAGRGVALIVQAPHQGDDMVCTSGDRDRYALYKRKRLLLGDRTTKPKRVRCILPPAISKTLAAKYTCTKKFQVEQGQRRRPKGSRFWLGLVDSELWGNFVGAVTEIKMPPNHSLRRRKP
jgi:hypothetical protein